MSGRAYIVDVLDRVLDKGIVIDAWVRVSLAGIELVTVDARVLVASVDTYLKRAADVIQVASNPRPVVVRERVVFRRRALAKPSGGRPAGSSRASGPRWTRRGRVA